MRLPSTSEEFAYRGRSVAAFRFADLRSRAQMRWAKKTPQSVRGLCRVLPDFLYLQIVPYLKGSSTLHHSATLSSGLCDASVSACRLQPDRGRLLFDSGRIFKYVFTQRQLLTRLE